MNIIFLDVDGVLNNWRDAEIHYEKTHEPFVGTDWPFSKESIEVLRKIVLETNSKIVISSSWRSFREGRKILSEKLKEYDIFKYVIGKTPEVYEKNRRECEILEYLKSFNEKDKAILILDDEYEGFKKLRKYAKEIDSYYGLQKKHIEQSINIFKTQEDSK